MTVRGFSVSPFFACSSSVVDFGEDHPAVSFLGLYGSLESLNRFLN
jgi:hypothetical protein